MSTRDLAPEAIQIVASATDVYMRAIERAGVKAIVVLFDWGEGSSIASVATMSHGPAAAHQLLASIAAEAPEAIKEWSDRVAADGIGAMMPRNDPGTPGN